jgi:hypothetical protein
MTKPRTFVNLPIDAVFNRQISAEAMRTLAAYVFHANSKDNVRTFVSAVTVAAELGGQSATGAAAPEV